MDLQFLSRWRIWNPGPVVCDADVEVVIVRRSKILMGLKCSQKYMNHCKYADKWFKQGDREVFGLPMDRSNKYPNMVIAVTYVCTSVVDI